MLISDEIDFKAKNVVRDKEGHFIMIRESIHEEDINNYKYIAPNNRAPEYIKQQLTEMNREDFCGGAVGKNPPANAGDTGLSPGPGRSHMPWSN